MRAKAEDGTHTLMKGDEVVKLFEKTANGLLLVKDRNQNRFAHQVSRHKLVHHRAAFRGIDKYWTHHRFARNVVFPKAVSLFDNWSQARKSWRHKPVTCIVENEATVSMLFVSMPLKCNVSHANDFVCTQGVIRSSVTSVVRHGGN